MLNRRHGLSLLLCGIGHFACSRAESANKPASDKANAAKPGPLLRLGFIGTGEAQPVGAEGWAYHQGKLTPVLAQLGFGGVTFVRFANGPDLNEALSGGSLDVGIYGDTPALVGRAAGLPTRLVNQAVVGMDAWLLTRADGPRSLDELAGKAVATSKGSYMNRYLAGLLLERGLKDKVKFAHLLPADAQAALDHGDIAAYAAPAQTAPLFVAKGARVLDRASDHTGLLGTSVTVMTDTFLADHPDFASIWNAARRRAVQELKQQSSEYYAYHAQTVRLPLDLVQVGYPLSLFEPEPLVTRGLQLLEGTKKFLLSQGLVQRDFSINDWVVPEARRPP
jgi:NitT/TauT family transport system substrate-binding protein/sulfonate transport system substrate-binding protein